MSIDGLLTVYLVLTLGAMTGLALYYERRRKRFEPERKLDNVFRCDRCAFVYTDDHDVDCSRCPQCGAMNDVVKF